MTLPFESDELTLLEACAAVLTPLYSAREEARPALTAPSAEDASRTVWTRSPGGSAAAEARTDMSASAVPVPSFSYTPPAQEMSLSAEALSKAFERDARRFDG